MLTSSSYIWNYSLMNILDGCLGKKSFHWNVSDSHWSTSWKFFCREYGQSKEAASVLKFVGLVMYRINIFWTYLMVVLVRNDFTLVSLNLSLGVENFAGGKYGDQNKLICFLCWLMLRIAIYWTYLMVVLVRIDFLSLHPNLGFENFVGRKYGQWKEAASVFFVLLCFE